MIQGYIGPDHKVIDMRSFYSVLVQALGDQKGGSMDDGKVKELIREHIFYEVWMLGSTRAKLLRGDYKDKKTCNAFIESFWVHARNLNEFFLENGKDDTLKAGEFATSEYKAPKNSKARKAPFRKVNKQISHLTRQRTSVHHDKVNEQDIEAIFQILVDDLREFDRCLKPELRSSWGIIVGQAEKPLDQEPETTARPVS